MKVILYLACSSTAAVAVSLRAFHSPRSDLTRGNQSLQGPYQNKCTGAYSDDIRVTKIDDCDSYTEHDEIGDSMTHNGAAAATGSMNGSAHDGRGTKTSRDKSVTESSFRRAESRGLEDIDCSITNPDDPDAPQKVYQVEYWYGVEASEEGTTWLDILEDKIYGIAIERMSWCIGEPVNVRRSLQGLLEMEETQRTRELGIVSVTSSPKDRERTDVPCPEELSAPGATNCYVIQGKTSIRARVTDDLTLTMSAIQSAVKDSMDKDELLGSLIPTVVKVSYLGTSENDVIPVIIAATPRAAATQGGNVPTIIGISTASAAALLLLLLFWRQKRQVATDRRFAALGNDDTFISLPGTGDPPGHFHYGLYHYLGDGQAYLSTNCADCHETRTLANPDYGGVLAPKDFQKNKHILANANNLAGYHSAMNVHKCTSSTCKLCHSNGPDVVMIPIDRQNSGASVMSTVEL